MGIFNGSRKLRNATLVFLIKKSQGQIVDICLAVKRRGFGAGRLNGVGGKVEEQDKTIEDGAKREVMEEIGVEAKKLKKVAELTFYFLQNSEWDQLVHVYFCEVWNGMPVETEEMKPEWFLALKIPYWKMWPDDKFWLPEVLKGDLLKATFKFGENDVILEKEINIVDEI